MKQFKQLLVFAIFIAIVYFFNLWLNRPLFVFSIGAGCITAVTTFYMLFYEEKEIVNANIALSALLAIIFAVYCRVAYQSHSLFWNVFCGSFFAGVIITVLLKWGFSTEDDLYDLDEGPKSMYRDH